VVRQGRENRVSDRQVFILGLEVRVQPATKMFTVVGLQQISYDFTDFLLQFVAFTIYSV